MTASDSSRFLVQMIMNVFICSYAQKKIAKIASKREGRRSIKSYLHFFAFAVILIALNQAVYFMFTPPNLYEELGLRRSDSIEQIKQYKDDLKIQIMQI